MTVDEQVQSLIHSRAPESSLVTASRTKGMRTMREDGARLVETGVTSLEEVLRVTRD
jgi:general secretion pathway protein E